MRCSLALLFFLGALLGCRSRHDPDNLHGVFDGSASAASATAPSASAESSGRRVALHKRAESPPHEAAPANRRKPIAGPCLARTGQAAVPHERPARRPACRRAEILEDRDPDGTPRYACVFTPESVEQRTPLPLLVFFHDDDESPAKVSKQTELRTLNDDFDVTGDSARKGFVVLAPQARRIGQHVGFDVAFVAADNRDVRTTDDFIERLATRGWIDRRRVYAIGAGRGAEMALMWSMLHPDRVAGFASYGASQSKLRSTCRDWSLPGAVVYRACDALTPCLDVEQWLEDREQADAPTLALRLGSGSKLEPSCVLSERSCGKVKGTANHHRWPKGKEKDILEFLARFSLDIDPGK